MTAMSRAKFTVVDIGEGRGIDPRVAWLPITASPLAQTTPVSNLRPPGNIDRVHLHISFVNADQGLRRPSSVLSNARNHVVQYNNDIENVMIHICI